MDNFIKKYYIVLVLLSMLSACGGGSSGSSIPSVKATDNGYYDFTLLFKVTNAGTGEVKITPSDTICKSKCTDKFPSGTIIKLIETAGLGSRFMGFSGDPGCSAGEINLKTNTTCIALFDPIAGFSAFNLAIKPAGSGIGVVNSVPPGIECGTVCNQDFAANLPITLTAIASEGNTFAGWSGTGCPTGAAKTVTVTMTSGPLECTATFEPSTTDVKLTVSLAGGGSGSVSSSIPTGTVCTTTPCETLYVLDSVVVLTAKPATDNIFVGWSGDCAGANNNTVTTVTMSVAKACTATFDVKPAALVYNLVITPVGAGAGRVTSIPSGIDCGTACNKDFATGTAVTLTATPADATSVFTVWGGACSGTTTSTTVTMNAAKACTATFDAGAAVKHNLTIVKAGLGQGVVTSITPAGINCGATCTAAYAANTVVTLSATASAGSIFNSWTGTGCGRTVTMTAAKTCTATFSIVPSTTYNLTASYHSASTGTGLVTHNTGYIGSCGPACYSYPAGYGAKIVAAADPNSVFVGWSGTGCVSVSGTTVAAAFGLSANLTCIVRFDLKPATVYQLSVVQSNTNNGGTFTISPGKTPDCATCPNYTLPVGDVVTLTGTPTPPYTKITWGGSGGCISNTNTVTVTMTAAIICDMIAQ